MKAYCIPVVNKWVDLEHVQEISYPQIGGTRHLPTMAPWFRYRLMFQEKESEVDKLYDEHGCLMSLEKFIKDIYEPFLEAWKNRDKKEVLPITGECE